jgi:hypothetical protein
VQIFSDNGAQLVVTESGGIGNTGSNSGIIVTLALGVEFAETSLSIDIFLDI